MISYSITLEVNTHTYLVTLSFVANKSKHTLKLPVWIPGSYMIREFSKNIVNLQILQSKNICLSTQINKNSWLLENLQVGSEVHVVYTVYANDLNIRGAFLDINRGSFNHSSLCLYVDGMEKYTHTITLNSLPLKWKIATSLTKLGKYKYRAKNYDELIDSPVELGNFVDWKFKIGDKPISFILSGTLVGQIDKSRFINDVSKICQKQIDLFGGVAPFKKYLFILYLGGEVYTGLEHQNSTLLMAPYYSMPILDQDSINDEYLKLLGLISHEFFHVWNVKRIKPQAFNPYDLDNETYTNLLWWFEGITSYYDDLILYRAGLIDKKRYLGIIAKNINDVYKYDGVNQQTLANSSKTAWVKYYKPDENSPNALVSYYVKGSLVGMCLDLLIRSKTKHKSLDHVMLGLYKKWQVDGMGICENELPQLIKTFTGCDLSKQIYSFVDTCSELPLGKLLDKFGIVLYKVDNLRYSDVGSVVEDATELPINTKFDLGCKLSKEFIGYRVVNVYNRSIAMDTGLSPNDVIIALDNLKLNDFEKQIGVYKQGSKIEITVFRHDKLIKLKMKLRYPNCSIRYLKVLDNMQLAKWL